MKKLLMLGGSSSQVIAIKKAKEMGYYVVTTDYLENNPGHQFSNEYHNVSTTDKEAILKLAKSLHIDGVVCYISDPGIPTAAYVSEELKLSSFPYKSVEILSNKDMFRSFLKENNFNVPQAKGYATLDEAKVDFHTFTMPVMIKPIDSSESRGVSKIGSIELLPEKVKDALSYSRAKRFIIEEYVERQGYQIGGECFFVNGKLSFSKLVNNHFEKKSFNPFLPTGESWPCNLPTQLQEKIHSEIQRLMNLLNMKTGPLIFEVQVDYKENVYILDIGARNSGDLTQVIEHVEGIDLIGYTIKAALDEDCSDLKMVEPSGYWAIYTLISQKAGLFKGIEIEKNFQRNYLVKYMEFSSSSGTAVKINESLGTILLRFSSMAEMLEKMDNMANWVKINIVEENIDSKVSNACLLSLQNNK
ncbi:carbamoyl-phosphate-synthetase [Solibacillus sp. R5-41]|uniref:ATP-grasp domain-containing protein n=1 Tax=Solibacillus sp. R5-41 TaxID=2048654 RepID=UPI000C124EFE|nr:ATP-grasp domain-containing protein [Solibacillus sp. R5-41]ATP39439.1 carbamoyl-phosphate-synthetase [Solibacillus sp. R5-41]